MILFTYPVKPTSTMSRCADRLRFIEPRQGLHQRPLAYADFRSQPGQGPRPTPTCCAGCVQPGSAAIHPRPLGRTDGYPVGPETLFALASVTKPVTGATVLTLVDDGLLSLDEPIGRIVPEFRASGETNPEWERLRPRISARQLLCHVSGLPEDLSGRESRYTEQIGIDEVIDQMLRLPLQSLPGAELRYSNAGFGVLTRAVERLLGRPFWEVAQERVLDPLELTSIVPDPQRTDLARTAHLADSLHAGTDN